MPPSTMTINGQIFSSQPGQSILSVARGAGIAVPTLCDYKDTVPTGACRVCVVEVTGSRTLLPACATQEGALPVSHRHHEPSGPWSGGKALECRVKIAAADAARYGIAEDHV